MLTKYHDTKIWALKYNNSDVSELKIDGSTLWKSPLEYTLLSNGTYSVKARVATQHVVGDENEYEDGSGMYYCQFIKPIDDTLVDPTSPSLSVNVIAGTNVTSIDSVAVLNGHIIVFAYVNRADTTSSIDLELRDLPETLVIPSTFNGKAVTKIEEGGFKDCTKLKTLVIPDSVTTYGDTGKVFEGCSNLTSITLPLRDYKLHYLFGASSDSDAKDYVPKSLSEVILKGSSISKAPMSGFSWRVNVYIASSITTIVASAFSSVAEAYLYLYCEASSAQSGWDSKWNYSAAGRAHSTNYSVTPPTYVTG